MVLSSKARNSLGVNDLRGAGQPARRNSLTVNDLQMQFLTI